jgi:RHH-type transcriptional regulator, rel operon repressor / antitoxin RelB
MSTTSTLTLRVPAKLKKRLDSLAKRRKISKSLLAADAVEQYVIEQEHQDSLIEKADAEFRQGKSLPHSDVRRWLLSWGKKRELPPPACE